MLQIKIKEVKKNIEQQNNNKQYKYRKSRFTASNFRKVCRFRTCTSRATPLKTNYNCARKFFHCDCTIEIV